MARFGKFGVKIPKGHPVGKNSRQEFLPSRFALDKLTKGDPSQRTINNYAKRTPVGKGAPNQFQNIIDMGQEGIDLKKR